MDPESVQEVVKGFAKGGQLSTWVAGPFEMQYHPIPGKEDRDP